MDVTSLLTGKNLILFGACLMTARLVRGMFFPHFETGWGERLLPVVPLIVGVVGALVGVADAETLADRVLLGIIAGGLAGQTYKVGKTSVLGVGVTSSKEDLSASRGV